jgi:enoyl-CoA hydratase/carnithine racemase
MFELSMHGATARLRLNRPEARNALRLDGWAALADAAEEGERGGAQVLILSGVPGGAFCSGADLAGFDAFREDHEARTEFRLAIRRGLDRLRALPIPTIALVKAPVTSGGCGRHGLRRPLAGPRAHFAITPAKLGVSYPQEDVHRLVALVRAAQASRLLCGAMVIDGAEAERIGLVERFAQNAAGEAEAYAAVVAANDPVSLRTLKRAVGVAEQGRSSDAEQDKMFDDLLGSDTRSSAGGASGAPPLKRSLPGLRACAKHRA